MIIFQRLSWANFLSTGNNVTTIDLEKNPSTLVIGANGAGKSTMLDALSFALFGKAHRNINKAQMINSINRKHCLVEVDFSVHGAQYKIVRGLKPAKFEIWKNGELINQNSHNKEYQKILEQNILKLNHKSFHQIVVLGSSSFIPFMQLTSQNRREVIEDLLDINVFSKMNVLLKEKVALVRDQLRDIEYQSDLEGARLEAAEQNVNKIKSINKEHRQHKESQMEEINAQISDLNNEVESLQQGLEESKTSFETEKHKLKNAKYGLEEEKRSATVEILTLAKHARFFETNDVCPTCDQDIDEKFKKTQISVAAKKAKDTTKVVKNLTEQIEAGEAYIKHVENSLEDIQNKTMTIHGHSQSIVQLCSQLIQLQKDIDLINTGAGDLTVAKKEIEKYRDILTELGDDQDELKEIASYQRVAQELLKDTGIKTKIIKQYLPVINQLVNQYLQVLDFFVYFNLDESFTETIRSRHRDDFSYDSFSEGEKQRIDLSLLFTWRQVAKMKNSVATNLLILDETFDSSLDADGVENLMKILHTLDAGTNVFIISHKTDLLEGKFENKIEFRKVKNFSVLA